MKNLTERINEIREELEAFGSPIQDPLIRLIISMLDEIVEQLNSSS